MEIRKLTHEDVLAFLPDRDPHAHKGNFGKILMLCGSLGYTGAPALAAMAALRTGAGLVYLGVPACIYEIEAIKLTEPIVFPLEECDGKFSNDAIRSLNSYMHDKDALLIGPGMGRSEGTFLLTKHVLENFYGPVILDADGINVLAKHKDLMRSRTSCTIITPHEGEFARLGGSRHTDRISAAKEIALDLGVIVLLKGHETIITDGYTTYVNPTGNAGMAVGGSGDVLSGMIAALLGQGISPLEAVACAAWLHGAAGDICAQMLGQYGMLPSDILNVLPRLLK